jgi:hypothetical protein
MFLPQLFLLIVDCCFAGDQSRAHSNNDRRTLMAAECLSITFALAIAAITTSVTTTAPLFKAAPGFIKTVLIGSE